MRPRLFTAALLISLGLALALAACSDSVESPGQPTTKTDTHIIRDLDFIKGTYFFFDHPLVYVGPEDASPIDVYLELLPADIAADPTISRQEGIGLVDRDGFGTDINLFMAEVADTLTANGTLSLDEAIYAVARQDSSMGLRNSNFRLLEATVDYWFVTDPNDEVVGIELADPLERFNTRSLATRYTNVVQAEGTSWRTYGVGGNISDWGIPFNPNIGEHDRLVLEILHAGRDSWPGLDFGYTWSFMMRHVYDLGFNNIAPASFSLDIEDIFDMRLDRTRPEGSDVPYIRIFGLDRTDEAGTGPPDGRIDLTTGIVDLEKGLLHMPFWRTLVLFPNPGWVDMVDSQGLIAHVGFWPDTTHVSAWTDGDFQFDGEYEEQWRKSRLIYWEGLTPLDEPLLHQYNIHAHWTRTVTEW